jgi:hypothetical protein
VEEFSGKNDSFELPADSSLHCEKIGASDSVNPVSPWPLQSEEQAMIPDEATRDWQKWKYKKLEPGR